MITMSRFSELIIENFFRPLFGGASAPDHRPYPGTRPMGDVMRAYGLAHVPEGEHNPGRRSYVVDLQHRGSHRRRGTFTPAPSSRRNNTWLREPLFLVTLEMMEGGLGWMFLDGINQIVNHGIPLHHRRRPARLDVLRLQRHSITTTRGAVHYSSPHPVHPPRRDVVTRGIAVNPVAVYLPLAMSMRNSGCGA